MTKWPSRKLQICTIIILALGAAITVFMPPTSRHAKAERLYLDGWFESSVPKLEKALERYPGNSMYEQALVYRYPKDKLPKLLKTRGLGKDAQALAAGLIYKQQSERTQDPKRKLVLVDELIKADPTNALPHYRKASILREMGRLDECLAEIRLANDAGRLRYYLPAVSKAIIDSGMSPLLTSMSSDYPGLRRDTMAIMDLAHVRLREGKFEEAAAMDCLRMAVITASADPHTIMGVLVGKAMHAWAWFALEPVYKDFGTTDRLARVKRLDKAYEEGQKVCRAEIGFMTLDKSVRAIAIPFSIAWLGVSAAALLVLTALVWALPAIRRRDQPPISLSTWSEGWIARASIINLPFLAGAVYLHTLSADYSDDYLWPYSMLIVLGQVIILGLGLRVLHHKYDESAGERTGILRFVFRSSAPAKAWTRKSLMVLFAGQIAFAACLALLAMILYKPIYGGHPWQPDRFEVLSISHEQATMRRVGDDLRKAYFYR